MQAPAPQSGYELPAEIAVRGDAASELTRRAHPEPPHPYRSPFARDIGRVLHARAFRRLAGKTQVFTRLPGEPAQDHFRSRLTHTLEVAQISRTIAAALGLNAELAEALALAHDIGHPPFGHAGERALDHALRAHGLSFDHNLHALRIVDWFEQRSAAYRGLNLTLAVREGIVKHSRDYSSQDTGLAGYYLDLFPPLEAQLIDLADEIAYLTADLDDGLASGILSVDQIHAEVPLFRRHYDDLARRFQGSLSRQVANEAIKSMLDALATNLIDSIHRNVRTAGLRTIEAVRMAPARLAVLSPEVEAERMQAKSFLYANLYNSPALEEVHAYAELVVSGLFQRLFDDPKLLPEDHREQIVSQGLVRVVTDYIAGMTDGFILQLWQQQA